MRRIGLGLVLALSSVLAACNSLGGGGVYHPYTDDASTSGKDGGVTIFGGSDGGTVTIHPDLSVIDTPTPDLSMPISPDLAMPAGGTALTGEACTVDADCAKGNGPNQKGKCLKVAGTLSFPGGYCSNPCRSTKDLSDGTNADCASSAAACVASTCLLGCSAQADCRGNYVCIFAGGAIATCEPDDGTYCNVNGNSCNFGENCVSSSPDSVKGSCKTSCSVFSQTCGADAMGNPQNCYVDPKGQSSCIAVNGGGGDGASCGSLNGCDAGFGCFADAGGSLACRPFCGGPNNVACTNGKSCTALFSGLATTVAGVCGL